MSVAFSTDDQIAIHRTVDTENKFQDMNDERFGMIFEIDRCIKWIREHDLKNVTLQFPDDLLPFSAKVALQIESEVLQRVSILGDTSYGDCCVDEVAAEHIGADGLIHFGNACLTPTRRLPVLYVYTQLPFHEELFLESLRAKFSGTESSVAIFYDVRYDNHFNRMRAKIDALDLKVDVCVPSSDENDKVFCGRLCSENFDSRWNVLYVGKIEKYALLLSLTFPQCSNHYMYNPESQNPQIEESSINVRKALMKRYYLIEKTKDASRVGILVGTLGVTRYRNVIDYVKDIVKKSGKKSYTFLVGKPNIPKLANFTEIDVFVLIACPENSVLDSKDFLVPIVTPFEIDVALNKDRHWSGNFAANFSDILPDGRCHVPFQPEVEADISLISGKVRLTDLNDVAGNNCTALATQETSLSLLHQSGGGEFLSQRSWRGLEQKLGETEVTDAIDGQSGIAAGYSGEGH